MKLISDKAVSAQIERSRLRASGFSASWLEEMEHLAFHVCNISCRQPPALPDFILLLCLSPSSFVHIPHVHLLFSLSSSGGKTHFFPANNFCIAVFEPESQTFSRSTALTECQLSAELVAISAL